MLEATFQVVVLLPNVAKAGKRLTGTGTLRYLAGWPDTKGKGLREHFDSGLSG